MTAGPPPKLASMSTGAASSAPASKDTDRLSPPQIARAIRGMISRGELQPGEHLGTVELADRFGVSRGPVREALRLLESSALVRILPQKGAFVMALGDQEVAELMEAREVLFAALAELAAARIGQTQIKALKTYLAALARLAEMPSTSPAEFQQATYAYVAVLYAAAGNTRLLQLMRDWSEGAGHAYGHLSMATQEMRQQEASAYARLTSAVADRDPQAAHAAARIMHADGVRRARELQSALPIPRVVEFRGRRRPRRTTNEPT